MRSSRIVALALAVACALGVASATSLGTFGTVTMSAGAATRTPCEVGTVEFRSGGSVLGGLLDLLTSVVDQVELSDLSGDCAGLRPIVVVYGDPNTLDGVSETVALSRTELAPLVDTVDVLRSVDVADELNTLLDLFDDPNEVRVAFCPVGVTTCEP